MATLGEMFANENVKKVETHPQRVTKWIHYTKLCDHPEQYCNEKNKEEIIQLAKLLIQRCIIALQPKQCCHKHMQQFTKLLLNMMAQNTIFGIEIHITNIQILLENLLMAY